jgi:hypothetical protein
MKKARVVGGMTAALGAIVVLAAGAAPVRAQSAFEPSFEVDGRLGLAVPFGGLADLTDMGLAASLGGAYWFHPRIAVRADWGLEALNGNSIPGGPDFRDLTLWHYTVGLETNLAPPVKGNVKFTVNGGLGATTLDFSGAGPSHTYFSLTGGARLLFPVGRQVDLFGGAQLNLAFTSGGDGFMNRQGNNIVYPLGTSSAWSLPLWGGLQVHFP